MESMVEIDADIKARREALYAAHWNRMAAIHATVRAEARAAGLDDWAADRKVSDAVDVEIAAYLAADALLYEEAIRRHKEADRLTYGGAS